MLCSTPKLVHYIFTKLCITLIFIHLANNTKKVISDYKALLAKRQDASSIANSDGRQDMKETLEWAISNNHQIKLISQIK